MARRFRIVFWLVVPLGAAPALLSGVMLLASHRLSTLCAATHPVVPIERMRDLLRWSRLHQWGRVGALVAALLVLSYAVAWAFEAPLGRGARALVVTLAAGVLLPSLGVALWSGRAVPWYALEPAVSLTGASTALVTPDEAWGGPAYCRAHPDELARLRHIYWLHIGGGALAFALTLALCDLGARWRGARNARDT